MPLVQYPALAEPTFVPPPPFDWYVGWVSPRRAPRTAPEIPPAAPTFVPPPPFDWYVGFPGPNRPIRVSQDTPPAAPVFVPAPSWDWHVPFAPPSKAPLRAQDTPPAAPVYVPPPPFDWFVAAAAPVRPPRRAQDDLYAAPVFAPPPRFDWHVPFARRAGMPARPIDTWQSGPVYVSAAAPLPPIDWLVPFGAASRGRLVGPVLDIVAPVYAPAAASLFGAILNYWNAQGLAATICPLVADRRPPAGPYPYAVMDEVGWAVRFNTSLGYWGNTWVQISVFGSTSHADSRVRGEAVRDSLDAAPLLMNPGSVQTFRRSSGPTTEREPEVNELGIPVWTSRTVFRAMVTRSRRQ